MQYTITISDARLAAGLVKQLAAYNAGQADADKLTAEQFIVAMLPLKEWADTYAPEWVPTGDWLQRWTAAEKKAIRAMGLTDAMIQGWLDDLDANPQVELTGVRVQTGVPYVCNKLEANGFFAAGQGAVRAAEILAF